jgi:hypothetical protein
MVIIFFEWIELIIWPIVSIFAIIMSYRLLNKHLIDILKSLNDIKEFPKHISELLKVIDPLKLEIPKILEIQQKIKEDVEYISSENAVKNLNEKTSMTVNEVEFNSDEKFVLIKNRFDEFVISFEAILARLSITYDKRQLSGAVKILSHGNRSIRFNEDESGPIFSIISKNQSMRRIKRPIESWFTREFCEQFEKDLGIAEEAIKRISRLATT